MRVLIVLVILVLMKWMKLRREMSARTFDELFVILVLGIWIWM